VEEEGDNDAAAQVDGNDGDDIEDDFVIEYDVRVDFDVRVALGVKIGIDEKTDRDEMVVVDVKNKVGVWVVVELAVDAVIEIFAGVASEGGSVGA
jgi:hypothetical protein